MLRLLPQHVPITNSLKILKDNFWISPVIQVIVFVYIEVQLEI